jgi:hypothetical protein
MDDKQLIKGVFNGGSYEVDLQANNVVAKIMYQDVAEASLTIKSKAGLDLLKKMIPGDIDDMIINAIEALAGV